MSNIMNARIAPGTRRISWVAPLLAGVVVVAACGDDETETGSGGGTSTSTATASAASTTTSASSSAATTPTSSTASGGEGGSGGGADGGGGGGGGDDFDYLAKCLWIDSCEADGGTPLGVEACLATVYETQWGWASTGLGELALGVTECRMQAEDCETERACAPAPSLYDDVCADVPGTDLCDGDVWVICDPEGAGLAALDCSARGQVCGTDFFAGCGDPAETCHIGETAPSCDDDDPNVLLTCTGAGFVKRVDCTTQNNFVFINSPDGEMRFTIAGETCGPDIRMGGDMGCVGNGADCEFFSNECDGDVMVTCAGGNLGRRDCSELSPAGQSCGYVQDGPFGGGTACGPVEPECVLTDGDESCNEGVITFCGYAGTETVDCVAAGYAGCDSSTSGGRTIAYCTE